MVKPAGGEVRVAIVVVDKAGEAAGIERTVGVHALRHTFATQAVAAGVPLSVVSRQLGHADIQTRCATPTTRPS